MSFAMGTENVYPTAESSFLQKPLRLLDAAVNLYGFIPEDTDPRWSFLSRYEQTKRETGFRPINFDNAWGATYLSEVASYRSGYVTTLNEENSLQLNRALDNLGHANTMAARFVASRDGYDDTDIRFSLTDRLTTDPTKPKQDVTPCPEALYQIRLYDDDQYLARVGLNVHKEVSDTILSLVNIQGVPSGVRRNAAFEKANGVSPFNLLVRRALSLAGVEPPVYAVRGLINPERGNPQLYWGVLSQEGVAMHHAKRKGSS